MKQVAIFEVNQQKKITTSMLIGDFTFEDLCKHEPKFKTSNLKAMFAQPSVKSVMVMLYTTKEGERRRCIAGSTEPWSDDEEIKTFAKVLAATKEVDVEFTSGSPGPRRIVQTRREDRDLLKDIFKNMDSSNG